MTDTPATPPDETAPRRFPKGRHPGRRVRWPVLLLRHLLAPPPHRRRLAEHRQLRHERPATPADAPRSNAPGRSGMDARFPWVERPPRGHDGGHFRTSGSQHPLPLVLPLPPFSPPCVPNSHGTAAFRSYAPEPDSPLRGGEWGWERPPSDLRIYGPETRSQASPSATSRGSLPTRACGAVDPCGKANPR